MSCNCGKKKLDTLARIDGSVETDEIKPNIVVRMLFGVIQLLFGMFMAACVLLCLAPLIIYILVCLILGRNINIVLRKPQYWFRRRKSVERQLNKQKQNQRNV